MFYFIDFKHDVLTLTIDKHKASNYFFVSACEKKLSLSLFRIETEIESDGTVHKLKITTGLDDLKKSFHIMSDELKQDQGMMATSEQEQINTGAMSPTQEQEQVNGGAIEDESTDFKTDTEETKEDIEALNNAEKELPTSPMPTSVRAKFDCIGVNFVDEEHNEVLFNAVVSDGSDENKSFSKYTPAAHLSMLIAKETTASIFFEVGKKYYLDFTQAE